LLFCQKSGKSMGGPLRLLAAQQLFLRSNPVWHGALSYT
jgi:hypothetical protein